MTSVGPTRSDVPPLDLADVSSKTALCATLRDIDVTVPARTEGRLTRHCEIWIMCRLLAALANADQLFYPLLVKHEDRPDFRLHAGERTIGVEVTEATSQQYAHYSAIQEREFPDVILDPGHFSYDAPKMGLVRMRELLSMDRLTSSAWVGDEPEKEWALFVRDRVLEKSAKLSEPGFRLFQNNWLAIYPNLPLPSVDLKKALFNLRYYISNIWKQTPSFDVIFIVGERSIYEISDACMKEIKVLDLWPAAVGSER